MDPARWRVGRSPGEKTVGASTNAKKISPPSQTTSDNSIRNRRNDMGGIIERLGVMVGGGIAARVRWLV